MQKGNFNFLQMVKRNIEFLNQNIEFWQSNAALLVIIKAITSIYSKIENYHDQQQIKIIGYAKRKDTQKNVFVSSTDMLIGIIHAYATAVNDEQLLGEIKYSRSDIWRLRDMELESLAKKIISISTSHLTELEEFDLSQEIIDTYSSDIKLYNEIRSEPAKAIKKRKTATALLKPLMAELKSIITNRLDKAMKIYKSTNLEFYMEYTKQREIMDTPTYKLSLKGAIIDLKTEEPLQGVIITIPELKLKTETTELGNYQFKNIKRGTYKVEFQREGYKPLTLAIDILDNKTTELDVKMERN